MNLQRDLTYRALVCKWETGSRLPAYSNVEELSTIFDVDSELLM